MVKRPIYDTISERIKTFGGVRYELTIDLDGLPIQDAISLLQKIEDAYSETYSRLVLDIVTGECYCSSPCSCSKMVVIGTRPMTPDEIRFQDQRTADIERMRVDNERQMYEALKAKFEKD